MISVCGPESTTVRCVEYHSDGSVLFTGAQDSLKVRSTTYIMLAWH